MVVEKGPESTQTTQVRIGGVQVGIVGLEEAVEKVAQLKLETDEEIGARLVEILKQNNYIPTAAEAEYRRDLTRYYRKKMGLPVDERAGSPGVLEVKVFGPGCARCKQVHQLVLDTIAAAGIAANVEYVDDVAEMAAHGVMLTPALMINGEVKAAGKMPARGELLEWLRTAEAQTG